MWGVMCFTCRRLFKFKGSINCSLAWVHYCKDHKYKRRWKKDDVFTAQPLRRNNYDKR